MGGIFSGWCGSVSWCSLVLVSMGALCGVVGFFNT